MYNTFQKIPFLRSTISLVTGVLIGSQTNISPTILILISFVLFVALFFLNQFYKFYFEKWFGLFIQILFISIGILVFELNNIKPAFFEKGMFVATVIEKPQEKQNSYKSILKVSGFKHKNILSKTNEKVLVYFEKEENARELNPGDQIIFSNSPQAIKNYGNPFEFDYKKYLANKKIYRQVYLNSVNWERVDLKPNFSITIYAEKIREKLLTVYRNQALGKNELEILSALTLGYKRELDPETKRVFSASGAMHVLAVSGLHVGIVFWIITLLFGFLRKRNFGRIFFVSISILALWSYAFLTGLSPSVMRAATMFTIFVVGDNLKRKANTYNSLAASAMCLLLINPNNLFEVGFQLSYSAVFGIVFLQPKLSKVITVKNKFLMFFWSLLTVSISAQIATFPLTAFYFNQFPSYFWITNLFVIPAVMILIPLGLALLLFSNITIISTILSWGIKSIIKSGFIILTEIEQLPYSVHEISIQAVELLFLIGILLSLYLLIHKFNPQHLKAILTFALLFLTTALLINFKQTRSHEIIVYNSTQNTAIQLISGRKNYVISQYPVESDKNTINLINKTTLKLKLNSAHFLSNGETYIDDYLFIKNGIILFEGKRFTFQNSSLKLPKTISLNLIINPKKFDGLEKIISKNTTIVTNKKFVRIENSLLNYVHQTSKHGAYREKW